MSRLLTFNCHEAYVHLLGKLGLELDIVDGLPGRHVSSWDLRTRPVPPRARLIAWEDVRSGAVYDAAIAHNLSDLLLLRALDVPKILVLHVSLAARAAEEKRAPPIPHMRAQLAEYIAAIGGLCVAVSRAKAESWGQGDCPVIRPCADPSEYDGHEGGDAVALRVANHVLARPARFAWDVHSAIVRGHAVRVVGVNPGLEGSAPAASWEDLRAIYRRHRAYVHSAGPGLDDGYNLAVVEAMTTGMPIVSFTGSESPVRDGYNGFISGDPAYLNARLGELLADRDLARALGDRARDTALEQFPVDVFVSGWHAALDEARRRLRRGRGAAV